VSPNIWQLPDLSDNQQGIERFKSKALIDLNVMGSASFKSYYKKLFK